MFFPRYTGWDAPVLYYGIVGLFLYYSAVLAEIVRSGILSISRGQREAASALGLSVWQTMRWVLLPQALRRMVPALVSQLITLVKDTSLLYVIAVLEITRKGRALQAFAGNPLQTYIVVGLIFFVVNWILSRIARRLEVRQRSRYGSEATMVGSMEDLAALEAGGEGINELLEPAHGPAPWSPWSPVSPNQSDHRIFHK